MDVIQKELRAELGNLEAVKIIDVLINEIPYAQIKGDFEEIIIDFIEKNKIEKDLMFGIGYTGEFPISIMNCGLLYWLEEQDFDPIQYFKSHEDASDCALTEFSSFLYP